MKKIFISFIKLAVIALVIFQNTTAFAVVDDSDNDDSVTSSVTSIYLNPSENENVSWEVEGYSPQGYKVVWSHQENPTYPTREGDKYRYLSDPYTLDTTLDAFDGYGVYYVRVCDYLNGECGLYSNQIEVTLGDPAQDIALTDITTHDYKEAINYLKNNGVVQGYEDGTFKPDQTINRAEFLKILMIAGDYSTTDLQDCFKDVTNEWFAPYICKAKNLGFVQGYYDGYFRPDQEINFVEAGKIIALALNLTLHDNEVETWYHKFISALDNQQAIPTSIGSFDDLITRGEMSEIVWRIKAQKKNKESYTYEGLKSGDPEEYKNQEQNKEQNKSGNNTDDSQAVNSITVTAGENGYISWTTDGYSEKGFKVVWSLNEDPTYPLRDGDKYEYLSNPYASSATISAFDGEGTYFVRVCEYLGGACGVYSNQIEMEL